MNLKCPDSDCHDKVVRLSFFMKIFGASVGLLITVLLVAGMYALGAEKKQNDHVDEHHTQIKVIENDIRAIKDSQKALEKAMDRIEDNQISKHELIKTIRDAIRDK